MPSTFCASILNEQAQPANITSWIRQPITGSVDGNTFTGPAFVPFIRAEGDKEVTVASAGGKRTSTMASSVDYTTARKITARGDHYIRNTPWEKGSLGGVGPAPHAGGLQLKSLSAQRKRE